MARLFLLRVWLLLALLTMPALRAAAEPIGFIERFALAADRETALRELVPGTEDYYYFHCLHYQVSGQLEKAEALLTQWKQDPRARTSGYLQGIEDRQRILTYSTSPDRTVSYLRERLGIRFDHRAPIVAGERYFPSQFDNSPLAADALVTAAEISNRQLTRAGLRHLAQRQLAQGATDAGILDYLLQQIDGPWLPELDSLVIAELKQRRPEARAFGDRPAHQYLTLDGLRRVAQEIPEVASSNGLVSEVLLRLRPSEDADMRQQPEVRAEYLRRIDEYVSTLPRAYDALKAATLHQRLQSDLAVGRPNRETLLRYLRLPRNSPLVPIPGPGEPRSRFSGSLVDLSTDFSGLALLPPIGDEQPLIRTYLEHFLRDAASTSEFDGLLRPEFLRQVFAEAKLLAGIAPAERWYEMLPQERAQALRQRVELTLAPDNPLRHDANQTTELKVDIKNVDTLVVCIYKINSEAYYRTHDRTIDTDIDLDALVPTVERQIKYTQDGVIRHRESIELEEISGRGVWIVDLLGGGLRARALIRRGDLRYTVLPSASGLRLIVLDEHRRPVPGARFILTGRESVADEHGMLTLPPMDVATQQTAILKDEDLAVAVQLEHPAESYTLQAAMYLDRQKIQSHQMTQLVIRPRLLMSGQPIDPELLKEPAVTIVATDIEGIATTKRFEDIKVNQQSESVVEFRVPPRVAKIEATLSGRVDTIAKNEQIEVRTGESWDVATVRGSSQTYDAYLTHDREQWLVEVLGLSGEPVAGAMVSVALTSEYRTQPIEATLQSDEQGRIQLGPLAAVHSLQLTVGGTTRSYDLTLGQAYWPARLHAVVGDELRLPLPSAAAEVDGRFRLLMLRAGRAESDRTSTLAIQNGLLVAKELEAGEYQLLDLQTEATVAISITDGPIVGRVAAGTVRHLELPAGRAVGMESLERTPEGLRLQLTGVTPHTRVHVVASRFHTDTDPLLSLRLPQPQLLSQSIWNPTSGYLSDLRLGDEYQYVMRRRYATKYPGVMLPQPGLILNPWETETTENQSQSIAAGDAMAPSAPPADRPAWREESEQFGRIRPASLTPDFDFLADSGVILTNLRADADGVVTVAEEAIADMPIIQVMVCDPLSVVRRTVFDSVDAVPARDLRLARAIGADQPYAFVRGVITASTEKPLDMASLGTAQVQVYSSVGELLDLFLTLSGDARLGEFRELGRWHKLDDAAKRAFYGRLACHELHLFLQIHDPKFFAEVVRPYLANKKEKQFVDHYLLDEDLTAWTQPWRFAELNAAEKALLARRVPELRAAILRLFRETIELAPDDANLRRRLVEVALAGRGLEQAENIARFYQGENSVEERLSEDRFDVPGLELSFGYGPSGPTTRQRAAGMGSELYDFAAPATEPTPNLFFESRDGLALAKQFAFYQQLDSTKQWAESQWDHIRVAAASPDLIPIDPFWLAWTESEAESLELNEHLLRPSTNRHAALVALALAGLPLESAEIKLPTDASPFAPPHPVAVVTKRLNPLKTEDREETILVGQRFEALVPTASQRDREKHAKPAPDEFIIATAYRGQIILTNPTPGEQEVDVLWQIPAGAVPLAGGQATDSRTLTLQPFQVEKIEYQFYFPRPGEFVHYPVCVSADGVLAARGVERTFNVLAAPSQIDEHSWQSIATTGSAEQIASFLQTANLRELDWNLVLHRLPDRAIYDAVTTVLNANRLTLLPVWGYALHHRDLAGIRTLLASSAELIHSAGPVLHSELLVIDPVERRLYEHLEYSPLVVPRIHPLREANEILNPTLLTHYRNRMRVIAYQPEANDTDKLALVYYLLLQNRIEEAISTFTRINDDQVSTRLQYDYVAGYLALHRGDLETAEEVALRHAQHPVPRWRARFASMAEQLQQRQALEQGSRLITRDGQTPVPNAAIESGSADLALIDRDRRGTQGADVEPAVDVAIDGRTIQIRHRNAEQAILNLYAVDPELLFSKTPFVRDDLASMAMVEATRTQQIELGAATTGPGSQGVTQVRLDENLARRTLMVEVVAGPVRATTLHFGGSITAYVSEGFGQVQVSNTANGTVVAGVYVKVYARHRDGTVKFYKDGYTDLRGRFDYVSLSTGDLATTQRLAILVIDPELGSTIREAAPPSGGGR